MEGPSSDSSSIKEIASWDDLRGIFTRGKAAVLSIQKFQQDWTAATEQQTSHLASRTPPQIAVVAKITGVRLALELLPLLDTCCTLLDCPNNASSMAGVAPLFEAWQGLLNNLHKCHQTLNGMAQTELGQRQQHWEDMFWLKQLVGELAVLQDALVGVAAPAPDAADTQAPPPGPSQDHAAPSTSVAPAQPPHPDAPVPTPPQSPGGTQSAPRKATSKAADAPTEAQAEGWQAARPRTRLADVQMELPATRSTRAGGRAPSPPPLKRVRRQEPSTALLTLPSGPPPSSGRPDSGHNWERSLLNSDLLMELRDPDEGKKRVALAKQLKRAAQANRVDIRSTKHFQLLPLAPMHGRSVMVVDESGKEMGLEGVLEDTGEIRCLCHGNRYKALNFMYGHGIKVYIPKASDRLFLKDPLISLRGIADLMCCDPIDDHLWICGRCLVDTNEDLLCCDTCLLAFHPACCGLKRLPKGSWSCPICTAEAKGTRPNTSHTRQAPTNRSAPSQARSPRHQPNRPASPHHKGSTSQLTDTSGMDMLADAAFAPPSLDRSNSAAQAAGASMDALIAAAIAESDQGYKTRSQRKGSWDSAPAPPPGPRMPSVAQPKVPLALKRGEVKSEDEDEDERGFDSDVSGDEGQGGGVPASARGAAARSGKQKQIWVGRQVSPQVLSSKQDVVEKFLESMGAGPLTFASVVKQDPEKVARFVLQHGNPRGGAKAGVNQELWALLQATCHRLRVKHTRLVPPSPNAGRQRGMHKLSLATLLEELAPNVN